MAPPFRPQDLEIRLYWANWHQWHPGQRVEQSGRSGQSLWLLRRGSVQVDSGESQVVLQEGQAWLGPGQPARVITSRDDTEWLSVGLTVLVHGQLDLLAQLQLPRVWDVPEADRAEVEGWMRRLVQHRRPRSSAEQVLVDGVARALVAGIWSALSEVDMAEAVQSALPAWLLAVTAAVRHEPGLGVEELAAVAGFSSVHLRREFARVLGVTPHTWLAARRLEVARGLLSATELPVRLVAARAGYDSASHFARLFRAAYGVSPAQYRRVPVKPTCL